MFTNCHSQSLLLSDQFHMLCKLITLATMAGHTSCSGEHVGADEAWASDAFIFSTYRLRSSELPAGACPCLVTDLFSFKHMKHDGMNI